MFFIVLEDTGYMAGIDSVELVISGSLVPDALRQNVAKPTPVMATDLREEVDEEDEEYEYEDECQDELEESRCVIWLHWCLVILPLASPFTLTITEADYWTF